MGAFLHQHAALVCVAIKWCMHYFIAAQCAAAHRINAAIHYQCISVQAHYTWRHTCTYKINIAIWCGVNQPVIQTSSMQFYVVVRRNKNSASKPKMKDAPGQKLKPKKVNLINVAVSRRHFCIVVNGRCF